MIPFLRKNKDDKKPPKSTVPHTAQESIPFQRMFEDGTCRVRPGYYTRTIQYQDINYQLAQQEDKTAIFEEWCSFLNFFDSSFLFFLAKHIPLSTKAPTKITTKIDAASNRA